ncbi:hypothetical protein, partial [Amycolatopsis thailandensis]|uniref:hypothetical protein n=1 Tax=Amycolatopsis thailandensis TaxID=589330 RepID=UPI00362B2ED7
ASPELVERLVEWRKGMHGYGTLESYILGDGQLRDAFPLARDARGLFIDPGTKEAVYAWARRLQGTVNPETQHEIARQEVVEWSGGVLDKGTVFQLWRVAGGERARKASGRGDGIAGGRVHKRLKSVSSAAVEGVAQSVKAAELGLRVVDVAPDGDCFYVAVLRTVPRSVWGPRLVSLGKELSSDGLREAVADAYRRRRSFFDLVLNVDGGAVEDGIRTRGHWDSESGDIAVQLVPDVLGVNLQTITPAGVVSTNGVTVHAGRSNYYLAYNGVDHYLATEPLAPASHVPSPPLRAGVADVDLPMRGTDSVPSLSPAARSVTGVSRPASAAPEQESPDSERESDAESESQSGDMPEGLREKIVSLVPPVHGLATLRAALDDIHRRGVHAIDITLGPDAVLEDPFTRDLIGEWALRVLDTTSFTPAQVADLSGGLITAHRVVTLYNTTHTAGIGDTGTVSWEDQARKRITWPPPEQPAHSEVFLSHATEHRLHPIMGMDGQFIWRDPADPLFRVHSLFADDAGELHPALRARADEITARIGEGKGYINGISGDEDDPRLPFMTPARLRAHWAAIQDRAAERMRHLVRNARNPVRGSVQPAPLHPTRPGQTVYVTYVKKNHVAPHEQVLIGAYQLCLAHPPGSVSHHQQPAFTNDHFIDFYLGALLGNDRSDETRQSQEQSWAELHPHFPAYLMQAGRGSAANLIAAEGAANSTAFANAALSPDGEPDITRTNAVFVGVTFTFPDFTKPTGTFKVRTTMLIALDNAFDSIANPYGILLAEYGEKYEFPIKEEPDE